MEGWPDSGASQHECYISAHGSTQRDSNRVYKQIRTGRINERYRGHVQDDEEDRSKGWVPVSTHPVLVDATPDPLHIRKVDWGVNSAPPDTMLAQQQENRLMTMKRLSLCSYSRLLPCF